MLEEKIFINYKGKMAFSVHKTIKLNEKIVWLRQIVSEDGIVLRIENAGVLK